MADILRAVLREVDTRSFLDPYLRSNVRADGRAFEDHREVLIRSATHNLWAAGSCTARSGGTVAVCGISVQIGDAPMDTPAAAVEGDIEFTCSIGPSCGLQFDKIKDQQCFAVEAALSDVFIRSRVIDRTQFAIQKFDKAYKLLAQVTFLSVSGPLVDAAVLAVRGALADLRVPVATSCHDDACYVSSTDFFKVDLARDPISVTCGIIDNTHLIVDPSLEEMTICSGWITAAFDSAHKVCYMNQGAWAVPPGEAAFSAGISDEVLQSGLSLCRRKVGQLRAALLSSAGTTKESATSALVPY